MSRPHFEVQVVTKQEVTTTERIMTAILTVYFLLSAAGISAGLYISFLRS
jgi:hypothetical protein